MSEIRLGPQHGAEALVLVLHGVGSSAADMRPIAAEFARALPDTAVVAPDGFEAFDRGISGRQWFSIAGVTEANRPERVAAALPRLEALIDVEADRAGVTRHHTALVGFSQGAIMALHVAAEGRSVSAVASFAGRLASSTGTADGPRPVVLLSHGTDDPVIPSLELAWAAQALAEAGATIETLEVPGLGHGIAPQQIERAAQFLLRVLRLDKVMQA